MKKVLIKAYSQVNLGDDLFVKILCDRYPDVDFIIVCPKSKAEPYTGISNLEVVNFPRLADSVFSRLRMNFNLYSYFSNKLAKQCDLTIHIGGSIFIQSSNWIRMATNYKELIDNSNQFMVLGSNFGPYEDREYYETYRDIFKKLDDITFREQESYSLFSDISQARLAPDIVFGLDTSKVRSEKTKEKTVVISVIDTSWREDLKEYQLEYENKISELSVKLTENDYEVILMSYCAHEGDERAVDRILSKHDDETIKPYYYRGNMEEALEIIKSSEGMVATRFHAFILGMIFDKPVFPFIYSSKITNVINDIEFTGSYIDISKVSTFSTDDILEQLYSSPSFNITKEVKESHRHFDKLDKILK